VSGFGFYSLLIAGGDWAINDLWREAVVADGDCAPAAVSTPSNFFKNLLVFLLMLTSASLLFEADASICGYSSALKYLEMKSCM
jgi:hypothetical protein